MELQTWTIWLGLEVKDRELHLLLLVAG